MCKPSYVSFVNLQRRIRVDRRSSNKVSNFTSSGKIPQFIVGISWQLFVSESIMSIYARTVFFPFDVTQIPAICKFIDDRHYSNSFEIRTKISNRIIFISSENLCFFHLSFFFRYVIASQRFINSDHLFLRSKQNNLYSSIYRDLY